MNFFVFWTKLDKSDRKSIKFDTVDQLKKILSAENKSLHDAWRLEIAINVNKGKQNYFYAFPSKIHGTLGLEWYENLNFAYKAQQEYVNFLRRLKKTS